MSADIQAAVGLSGATVTPARDPVPTAGTKWSRAQVSDWVWGLRHSVFLNGAILFTFTLILNRESPFVPSHTEQHYLLHLSKQWNPHILPHDWTFAALPSHFVFNFVFGPLTVLFPLEVVGWIGRGLSWSLIVVALLQLVRHFGIPLWTGTIAILLWLVYRQSIVGGEWILATFEAKSIAYVFLLFALNGFLRGGRVVVPSMLLGLSFSFHPLIGLWSVLAVGLSLAALRYPLTTLVRSGLWTALFALPGAVPLLLTATDRGPDTIEATKFVTTVVMPYHFDPFFFGTPHALLLLAGMLSFNVFHAVWGVNARALRLLAAFQVFLAIFFALGFLARYLENYQLLLLMPCRVFPVLLPLFFFLAFASVLYHRHSTASGRALVWVGLVVFASCGSLVESLEFGVGRSYVRWKERTTGDQIGTAFRWISGNTPADAVIISPPWRPDSHYLSRRAQIASWSVPRFDQLAEWRARLESLVGDVSGLRGYGTRETQTTFMASHYDALSEADIATLATRYGADYLVSSSRYRFPVVFEADEVRVYSLVSSAGASWQGGSNISRLP